MSTKRGELNPIDADLLAAIACDAEEGSKAQGNIAYAAAIGRHESTIQDSLQRLKLRGLIVIETTSAQRRRIGVRRGYTFPLTWTDWSERVNAAAQSRRGVKQRQCLCCREPFPSGGIHNRLCSPCKSREGPPAADLPRRDDVWPRPQHGARP